MSDRKGVVLLFFDLPSVSKEDKRIYNRFRKKLLTLGFLQLQESVYVKLLHNISSSDTVISEVKAISPAIGQVCAMKMSIAQFASISSFGNSGFDYRQLTDDMIFI